LTPFGTLPDGREVFAYTLANAGGAAVRVMTLGATIVSLTAPDRSGQHGDVVLGHDDLDSYVRDPLYIGPIVGRYANRIAQASFVLDGRTYSLPANDGRHHLHGGPRGFHRALWDATPFADDRGAALRLSYVSPDGEEGYPGRLATAVTYTWTDAHELIIDSAATTDHPTLVNLTQHSYFNLAGTGDVRDHVLTLHADRYTPIDAACIPTGELASVEGTPFDFRRPTAIGARIDAAHEQLARGYGYDHNFVVRRDGPGLAHAAHVDEPVSGRTLDVFTTEPGLQLYSGNHLGEVRGKRGQTYGRRYGFCLETQHFPDSPHQPAFPSAVLRPGQEYRSRTVWGFGCARER
jgi:aldose 1-epimerase